MSLCLPYTRERRRSQDRKMLDMAVGGEKAMTDDLIVGVCLYYCRMNDVCMHACTFYSL